MHERRKSFLARAFAMRASLAFLPTPTHAVSASGKSWSLAASGDNLGNVVDTNDSSTLAVWDLVRAADFGFFNLKGQTFNLANYTGHAASENGGDNFYGGVGGGPAYDPGALWRLREYGFNLASHANNHAWDYDLEGMQTTRRYLNEAGMTFAGTDMSLVCAAGSHAPQAVAGPGDTSIRPRPGVSALRAQAVPRVNQTVFEHLKAVAQLQGQTGLTLAEDTTEIRLYVGQHPVFYSKWRLAEDDVPGLDWDINAEDYRGILTSIREAKANSDAAIFSLHAHESDSGAYDSDIPMNWHATVPASYTQNISRAAIDAGADVVLVHGPHQLRGIEIHNGRPIFYSLSSLTYNLGLRFRGFDLPLQWDDGMITTVDFEDGALAGVTIHPFVHSQLQNDTSLPDKMMPKLAPEPQAIRILGYLQRASEPFGTVIDVEGVVGRVRLGEKPNCGRR